MQRKKIGAMDFHVKQFPNLIVRLVTLDHCYICDECKQIHKRDGTEIRLDEPIDQLMANKWWYGAVCQKGHHETISRAVQALREGILRSYKEENNDEA